MVHEPQVNEDAKSPVQPAQHSSKAAADSSTAPSSLTPPTKQSLSAQAPDPMLEKPAESADKGEEKGAPDVGSSTTVTEGTGAGSEKDVSTSGGGVTSDDLVELPPFVPNNDLTLAQQLAENEYQMYERNTVYMQEVEAEVRDTQPLISDKEDIIQLVLEYDEFTSPEYFQKAQELAGTYSHIRRMRGDGNCFYRAVLTAELERCFRNKAELVRFTAQCKGWRQKLLDFGFPELTTTDFCDATDTLLESIANGTKSLGFLLDDLAADGIANYYVAFLRLICSGFLRENEATYADFIEGGRSLDQFCKDEVEPMWREADHICIIALVNAMKVNIRIEYMDRSDAPDGGWHHDFSAEDDNEQKLCFLYRPGHYDILYRPEDS